MAQPVLRNTLGSQPLTQKRSILPIALFLLALFAALYSLTYSGTFVTDDEQILASRALSLAYDRSPNDTRVYGNSRVFAFSNLPAEQASQAVNIEPGQELVGSLLARLSTLFPVGHVQFLFLLNIWVTALTVAAVFGIVLILGYSRPTAFVVSILFGLGTSAWPYARTYFRDPLAVLFLTLAWACVQGITRGNRSSSGMHTRWLVWIGLIVFLSVGILTKNTIAIVLPVVLAELIPIIKRSGSPLPISRQMIAAHTRRNLLILAGLVLLLVVWTLVLPGRGLFARFTPGYYLSLFRFFLTSPHPHFLEALAGPFFSPGKSIFLYSPVLVLSIIGLLRYPKTAWSAWTYAFLLVVGQALFYDGDWWGHINWGLRFMLPTIPLLMIASAPVVESWLRSPMGRIGLIAAGGLSGLVQLAGILPPMLDYYVGFYNIIPALSEHAMQWTMKYSALAWHLKWFLSGGRIDLAAARVGLSAIPVALGLMIVISLALLGMCRISWRTLPVLTLCLALGMELFMLGVYAKDPAYSPSRMDLAGAQRKISQKVQAGDLVLIKSYSSPAWTYWMNWAAPWQPWTSLPYYFPAPNLINEYNSTHDPEVALDAMTLSLLRKVPALYRRVWLVLPGDSPGADLNLEVAWLDKKSSTQYSWDFPGNEFRTRVYLFEIVPEN